MYNRDLAQKYLDAGLELGVIRSSWDELVGGVFENDLDTKLLDNVLNVMKLLQEHQHPEQAIALYRSQEHVDIDLEKSILTVCHPKGHNMAFIMDHDRPIPGTYPKMDVSGNPMVHTQYPDDTIWRHFDRMIEQFARDEANGQHTCAWFNGRLYYSSSMDYNDPGMAMSGKPTPSKEEIQKRIALEEERMAKRLIEYKDEIRGKLVVLSPDKQNEWLSFFGDGPNSVPAAYSQKCTLDIIEMINAGTDLDVIKQQFDAMDLDRMDMWVASYVEQFADNGDGFKKFLLTGERDEMNISHDDGRSQS